MRFNKQLADATEVVSSAAICCCLPPDWIENIIVPSAQVCYDDFNGISGLCASQMCVGACCHDDGTCDHNFCVVGPAEMGSPPGCLMLDPGAECGGPPSFEGHNPCGGKNCRGSCCYVTPPSRSDRVNLEIGCARIKERECVLGWPNLPSNTIRIQRFVLSNHGCPSERCADPCDRRCCLPGPDNICVDMPDKQCVEAHGFDCNNPVLGWPFLTDRLCETVSPQERQDICYGACCFPHPTEPEGFCARRSEEACFDEGGTYHGHGSDCIELEQAGEYPCAGRCCCAIPGTQTIECIEGLNELECLAHADECTFKARDHCRFDTICDDQLHETCCHCSWCCEWEPIKCSGNIGRSRLDTEGCIDSIRDCVSNKKKNKCRAKIAWPGMPPGSDKLQVSALNVSIIAEEPINTRENVRSPLFLDSMDHLVAQFCGEWNAREESTETYTAHAFITSPGAFVAGVKSGYCAFLFNFRCACLPIPMEGDGNFASCVGG